MNEILTDKNFLLFCARHYEHPHFDSEEFFEDLSRLKYIKKLITRYIENGDLKERLILNHIIILNNCFGPEHLTRILYLKLKPQMKYIKPFLVLINAIPDLIHNVDGEHIVETDNIPMDELIVARLRKI